MMEEISQICIVTEILMYFRYVTDSEKHTHVDNLLIEACISSLSPLGAFCSKIHFNLCCTE